MFSGVSMQQVWDTVNLFQLIVHLDRLQVALPENVVVFLASLVDLTNLKVLPTEGLTNRIQSQVSLQTPEFVNIQGSFEEDPYSGPSVMKNLLGIATTLIGMLAAYGSLYAAIKVSNKLPRIHKFLKQLRRKLYFNSIIRTLYQSYMVYLVSIQVFYQNSDLETNSVNQIAFAYGAVVSLLAFIFPIAIYRFLVRN